MSNLLIGARVEISEGKEGRELSSNLEDPILLQ